jgi:hypothetical protein
MPECEAWLLPAVADPQGRQWWPWPSLIFVKHSTPNIHLMLSVGKKEVLGELN